MHSFATWRVQLASPGDKPSGVWFHVCVQRTCRRQYTQRHTTDSVAARCQQRTQSPPSTKLRTMSTTTSVWAMLLSSCADDLPNVPCTSSDHSTRPSVKLSSYQQPHNDSYINNSKLSWYLTLQCYHSCDYAESRQQDLGVKNLHLHKAEAVQYLQMHTMWMKTIQQDLKSNNLSLNEATDAAQNHPPWRLMSTSGGTHSWWCVT